MRRLLLAPVLLIASFFLGTLLNEAYTQITVPNTFTAGQTITAASMNTNFSAVADNALNRVTGGTITGNVSVSNGITIDGVDISARDAVLTTTTTTANAALARSGGNLTGNVTADGGVTIDGVDVSGIASVPTGAVMYFNLGSCPTGWTEYTAARGLYIVGLPSGGTLQGTAGTALTNVENRAAGAHDHTITDPGHTHTQSKTSAASGASTDFEMATNRNTTYQAAPSATQSNTTGITVNGTARTGNAFVAGTNAPYIQLLACTKS